MNATVAPAKNLRIFELSSLFPQLVFVFPNLFSRLINFKYIHTHTHMVECTSFKQVIACATPTSPTHAHK